MADVAALAVDLAELLAGGDSDAVDRVRVTAARAQAPRLLANAAARCAARRDALLVLDDYQFALAQAAADAFVQELVSLLPVRLLITTRLRPTWLTGRAVVYGRVRALAQRELAFTDEEARSVLPDSSDIREHAQGWPAVIGLAAFAGTVDLERNRPPEDIYDFLAREIVGALDAETKRALLALAAGGDESPDVAQQLLGADWAEAIDRAAAHGLVTRRDDGWVSMHPLLRQFFFRQLRQSPPSERKSLLANVLTTLRDQRHWDACLALLTAFPEREHMGSVLRDALVELLSAGRTATIEEWVTLGTSTLSRDPIFTLAEAEIALRRGDDRSAVALAENAATRLSGDFAARAHLTAARGAHQLDDAESAIRSAHAAERLSEDAAIRTEALWLAFVAAYESHPHQMLEAVERLRSVADQRTEHAVRVVSAETFIQLGPGGNLWQALASAERAVTLARNVRDPLSLTNALNLRAHLLKECGRYAEALDAVPELLAEADASGLGFVVHHALLVKAGALVGVRAINDARRTLRALEQAHDLSSGHVARNATMTWARLRIAAGDLRGAAIILDRDLPAPPLLQGEVLALRCLVLAALGEVRRAEPLLRECDTFEYVEPEALRDLTQAVLDLQQRRTTDDAVAHLVTSVLALGAGDAVVTACRAYPTLAASAVSGGAGPALEEVFFASNDRDLGRHAGLAMPRERSRGLILTPREREVLELMVAGRTNSDIASTLFISQSTAKVHIRHIFEKLGVHSRAEAVAVAADWL
jgi:ATP/maltotriose-dependent transcriptional regulator MalT